MATCDVPGSNPANKDELAMGCWAEDDLGTSLIFVQSTEDDRVIYSVFDLTKNFEYRDAMPKLEFEKFFGWNNKAKVKWTWHDKTPFPWNRVIKAGAQDGIMFASAGDQLSAADKLREHIKARAMKIDVDELKHRAETQSDAPTASATIMGRLGRALSAAAKELLNGEKRP